MLMLNINILKRKNNINVIMNQPIFNRTWIIHGSSNQAVAEGQAVKCALLDVSVWVSEGPMTERSLHYWNVTPQEKTHAELSGGGGGGGAWGETTRKRAGRWSDW